jgi:hypothetical protein
LGTFGEIPLVRKSHANVPLITEETNSYIIDLEIGPIKKFLLSFDILLQLFKN